MINLIIIVIKSHHFNTYIQDKLVDEYVFVTLTFISDHARFIIRQQKETEQKTEASNCYRWAI